MTESSSHRLHFFFFFPISSTHSFLDATPTAELEPITETYVQADEVDMGMTYDELSEFGRLRKVFKCGPYSMFTKLIHTWGDKMEVAEVKMLSDEEQSNQRR